LEIAQRKISFCHFDLHTGNIIIKKIHKPYKYHVCINNQIYTITAHKYIPVIIDFGLSSVKHNENTIGTSHCKKHGIRNYLIPGVDMYKFLAYSYYHSKGEVSRCIQDLLTFYGILDPYKLLIINKKTLNTARNEYFKKITWSKIANLTPLNFLMWIYKKNLTQIIQIDEKYVISKSDTLEMPQKNSYVFSMYIITLLKNCVKISKYIKKIQKKKNILITQDKLFLKNFKKIQLPEFFKLNDYSKRILNINTESKTLKNKKVVIKLINNYINSVNFYSELKIYINYLYLIRALGLETYYKDFLTNFLESNHYDMYNKIKDNIDRTTRWCNTLIECMI